MSQTATPIGFGIFNFPYDPALENSNLIVPVETYAASSGATACTYLNKANNTMELSQAVLPDPSEPLTFDFFELKIIAVYCRPNYNSTQFPNNPRFPDL